MTTTAAIYARVSRGPTGGQDLDTQLLPLRDYVAKQGWEAREWTDTISRITSRRPGLDALLAAVKRREVDVVVVAAMDRLCGSLPQAVRVLELMRVTGCRLVALREAVDSATPSGKALLSLSAVLADLEVDNTRERIMAGLDRARRQGKKLGRPRRHVDLGAARRLLQEGQSQRAVAAALGVSRGTLRRALGRAENPT